MSRDKVATLILILILMAAAVMPFFMPIGVMAADGQAPQFVVAQAVRSGEGFLYAYLGYWSFIIARPDASKLLLGYAGFMGFAVLAAWFYIQPSIEPRKSKSGILGDAKIIKSPLELRRKNDWWDGKGTPKSAGLVLGATKNGYYYDSSVPMSITVGKTGSGKSQFMVLETLHLLMASKWNIIATGKDELLELTGEKAEEVGYEVFVLDLNGYPGASCFNPIDLVVHYFEEGQEGQAMRTARQVAKDLIPISEATAAPYFPKAARSLLTAVILLVALADIPRDQKNMSSVASVITRGTTGDGADPSILLKDYIRSLGEDSPVYECASEFLSDGGKTVAGKNVISNLKDALSIFNDTNMREVTARSDVSMHDLIRKQTITYVHLLEENHPYMALFTVFFNQYWRVAQEVARENAGRLPRQTAIVGDELGNCNRLDCLPEIVTLGRSMRFFAHVFVQNGGQTRRYNNPGDHDAGMNKLLGSMGIKVALSLGANEDFEYFTKLAGKRTVHTQSSSSSTQGLFGQSSSGTSYNETADDLIHTWEWQNRTPVRDGSIVIKGGENSRPGREGVFNMPLTHAHNTPAGAYFKLGKSPEEDFKKRYDFRTKMLLRAPRKKPIPKPWCPDSLIDEVRRSDKRAIASDEFSAWDRY